jgi:hypothetical protein
MLFVYVCTPATAKLYHQLDHSVSTAKLVIHFKALFVYGIKYHCNNYDILSAPLISNFLIYNVCQFDHNFLY